MVARTAEAKEREREAKRRHYHNNKDVYIARAKAQRKAIEGHLRDLKESRPCLDCGIRYPYYVMDFDHRDPRLKLDVVRRVGIVRGFKAMLEEIEKCDLVCANCHRIRTHETTSGVI